MAEQIVNLGTAPNDGTGDALRVAFQKLKDNDHELYQLVLTAAQKAALAGTQGAPDSSNKFVTDQDARLSNSRTPTGTAGGNLTGTYPNPSIAQNSVTNERLADMLQSTIKGRISSGTGDPEDLTPSQLVDLLALTFLQLTDVPNSYVGNAGKVLKVKVSEDGLEFGTGGGSGSITEITGDPIDDTDPDSPIVEIPKTQTVLASGSTAIFSITDYDVRRIVDVYVDGIHQTEGSSDPDNYTLVNVKTIDFGDILEVDSKVTFKFYGKYIPPTPGGTLITTDSTEHTIDTTTLYTIDDNSTTA